MRSSELEVRLADAAAELRRITGEEWTPRRVLRLLGEECGPAVAPALEGALHRICPTAREADGAVRALVLAVRAVFTAAGEVIA